MRTNTRIIPTLLTLLACLLRASSIDAQTILNGSFETPNLGGGWMYQPAGASWNFSQWSGITGQNSDWGFQAPADGVQSAILQSFEGNNSEINQTINGFTVGQNYVVKFAASQRAPIYQNNQDFNVLFDNTLVGHFQPSDALFQNFETSIFTATATIHTLRFVAVNSAGYTISPFGDDTALIDNVTVVSAPCQTSPSARYGHSMAFDTVRHQTVLFGGSTHVQPDSLVNETWTFDGASWTKLAPNHSPTARYLTAMAYDAARQQVVLFGGTTDGSGNGIFFGDTWVWDGADWTQKSPTNSPSLRALHAMAYDAERQQIVLFGGSDGVTYLDDTWTWDGTNWTLQHPTSWPQARGVQGMAYDAPRQQIVLFGGYNGGDFSDTWVWDGTDWTETNPNNSPAPRDELAMTYDSARQEVVLFGGSDDETWTWNGTDWTQKTPAASPSGRRLHAMAFDNLNNVAVLFGGDDNASNELLGDTWQWDGSNWASVSTGTPLEITCPADIVTSAGPGQCSEVVNFTVSANCSDAVVVCNPPSGSNFPLGTTTVNCTATDSSGNTAACSFTVTVNPSGNLLTALGPATIWVGLKNSDDAGIRFDLRAEVYRNGTQLVGSGELTSVPGGSSGFNNAKQNILTLTPVPCASFISGDSLSIKLFVRNACTGSGKNSGTARLWYGDASAKSRFDATIGSPAAYYLLNGFALGTAAGSNRLFIDVQAGAKCSSYKQFGSWSLTLP